jgi:hypothetical protein
MSFKKSTLYRRLVWARHSPLVRRAIALTMLPSQMKRARHNYPYFAVDIRGRMGVGAVLAHAIVLIRHAEAHGLIPSITSTNSLFSRNGGDFLSEYMGPDGASPAAPLRPLRFDNLESVFHLAVDQHVPIAEANRIFWRYLPPKPVIADPVEAVLRDLALTHFDLSVHYRGTDKFLEGARIGYDAVEQAIARHLDGGGRIDVVFLATDDVGFDNFLRSRLPGTAFITYTRGHPSDRATPRHFSDMAPHDKAIEALVNILLIARAPKCIRTTSYMSAISKITNPSLMTETLNRTYLDSRLFPEREVIVEEV